MVRLRVSEPRKIYRFRLTDFERQQIITKAALAGLTFGAFIRSAALGKKIRQKDSNVAS
jgi:hypothetical protein